VGITDIPWAGFVSQIGRTNRSVQQALRQQLRAR
jgi:hypothetical protein